MKSKVFKEIIKEISEELGLPYRAVYDSVTSNFLSLREEVEGTNMKDILTKEQYDEVPKAISMKGFGSFHLNGEKYILGRNRKIKENDYDKEKNH